ncbi:MAG: hypothetical protein DRN12_06135 [Thermoplasmata archaeon]|nr:MAG: hypothetical protein DRN12_06135 [Thermoplasmata archaeon]
MASNDNLHRKFVPELHDIGKLVDDSLKDSIGLRTSRGRKHTFEQFNFGDYTLAKPSSPSWFGQFHHIWYDVISDSWVDDYPKGHDCRKIDQIEIDAWNIIPKKFRHNLFILIIADHLASSVSRATIELGRGHTQEGILKLWNKSYYTTQKKKGKSWAAFKSINDLKLCSMKSNIANLERNF